VLPACDSAPCYISATAPKQPEGDVASVNPQSTALERISVFDVRLEAEHVQAVAETLWLG
jgi:hypothetical protein